MSMSSTEREVPRVPAAALDEMGERHRKTVRAMVGAWAASLLAVAAAGGVVLGVVA